MCIIQSIFTMPSHCIKQLTVVGKIQNWCIFCTFSNHCLQWRRRWTKVINNLEFELTPTIDNTSLVQIKEVYLVLGMCHVSCVMFRATILDNKWTWVVAKVQETPTKYPSSITKSKMVQKLPNLTHIWMIGTLHRVTLPLKTMIWLFATLHCRDYYSLFLSMLGIL